MKMPRTQRTTAKELPPLDFDSVAVGGGTVQDV